MRRTSDDLATQFRIVLPVVGQVFLVSALPLAIVALLYWQGGVPLGHLLHDASAVAGVPAYVGFLSNVGILTWVAAAALCLFTAALSRSAEGARGRTRFLFASGLLTLLLAADDLFLFHEQVFPQLLGIPEMVTLATYGVLSLFYLVRFFAVLLETEYLLLSLAFFLFGTSVALDVLPISGALPFILEDTAKFVGIVAWLTYFYRLSARTLVLVYQNEGAHSQR